MKNGPDGAAALHVASQHEPSPQEVPLRVEKARWGLWLRPLRFTLLRNMSLRRKKCPFGSLLVAQFAAQDFAYGGLGQLGAELDHLGLLVAREVGLAIFLDLGFGEGGVFLDDH